MKILMINSYNYGSTGNIMLGIAKVARTKGHTCYTACPDGRSMRKTQLDDHIYIGTRFGKNLHWILGYLTGFHGVFSVIDTWRFLKYIDRIKPDIIHLHNLHNCYINLPLLFRYIKKNHIRTVWTLHDCWSFTGQCPHFTMAKCEKWKTGCYRCPQHDAYPASKIDQTKLMWKLKRKWFTGIEDMTIVTPSQWLAGLVKQSFLKEYPISVIHNGIDLTIFKPSENPILRNTLSSGVWGQDNIILGAAFSWGKRKGLDVFVKLAEQLKDGFRIILVGTDQETDRLLPGNIISIHKTENQKKMAEFYSLADVFVNPTREEVFGLVNVEALACGTPVITFNTGGSPECIDKTCGNVVDCDDINALEKEIKKVCSKKIFNETDCRKRAENFDMYVKFEKYVELYERHL